MESWRAERKRVIGEALTQAERSFLVDTCQKYRTKRQINLGRDGLTHNMLNDIYNNWKYAEAVRIKYLGVPTVDMKNVCIQLEDLVPCVLVTFDKEQIVVWRGKDYSGNNLKSDTEILSTDALNSEASPTEKSDIDTSDRSLDDESLVSDAGISGLS